MKLDNVVRLLKEISLKSIPIHVDVMYGDSFSLTVFGIIMDKIIAEVKTARVGYGMGNQQVKIICYADDGVIIAENEKQKQLHK